MFSHLHLHTKYSLLDATIKIDELMSYISELGQTAVAITDHGNMYGVVEFYKKAKAKGIKPIIGCEVYICADASILKRENTMYHLILLCKNEIGRQNLQRLVSESTKYKFNKRPRIDFAMLEKYHEGLICMSACMAGEVARALQQKNGKLAVSIATKYKKLFGNDYYIEYQAHSNSDQQWLNKVLIKLANKLDIKYVVTCDSHYLTEDAQKYHNIFVQIGQAREVGETYDDCYVQSEAEVLEKCKSTAEYNQIAINNIQEIVDKCNVDYPLSAPIIPHVDIPKEYNNEAEYLKALCNQGMKNRGFANWNLAQWKKYYTEKIYDADGTEHIREIMHFDTVKEIVSVYKERAKYELNAVLKMGFEGYYLLVHSYVSSAKRRGIARGSAGGSLLAYLIGIVDIDPIKYGLYFERFIDVGAVELLQAGTLDKRDLKIPDVDEDFSTRDRNKVMQFIINHFGADNVVALGQFGYLWAKGSIKDIGKILGIPFEITNEITKNLEDETIDEALQSGILDKYKDQYPELFEYASKISGLPKSHGSHPCGKVIAMERTDYYNAIEYDVNNDTWVLEGDMHTADDLGLVKIDLLGLRTLDVIYDVLEMIDKDYDFIAPHNIDLCDQAVWHEFAEGNTSEIFQFESPGMRNTLRSMHCNSIEDLSAANALYRPGSKDYIPNYVARKNGEEDIVYINDDLKPILSNTYAIITYQEQLIEIGRMAGLSNPDELRKATAKKKPKLMAKIEPEMKQGLIDKGWTQEEVDALWNDILKFARYSFNRSHSAAYALTAYITMFLKVHYPYEFITAAINSYDGSTKDIINVLKEAKRMGVKFQYDEYYELPEQTYYNGSYVSLGVNTIKGVGCSVAQKLYDLHTEKINSFIELLKINTLHKYIDKKIMMPLIMLDFFHEYDNPRNLLIQLEWFEKLYNRKQFTKEQIQELSIPKYLIEKNASKITEKTIKFDDTTQLILDVVNNIKKYTMSFVDYLRNDIELLGYSNRINENAPHDHYLVIYVDSKYGNIVEIYRLYDGFIKRTKISKNKANVPPKVGDIMRPIEYCERFKKKKVGEDPKTHKLIFEETDETEIVLSRYTIVNH